MLCNSDLRKPVAPPTISKSSSSLGNVFITFHVQTSALHQLHASWLLVGMKARSVNQRFVQVCLVRCQRPLTNLCLRNFGYIGLHILKSILKPSKSSLRSSGATNREIYANLPKRSYTPFWRYITVHVPLFFAWCQNSLDRLTIFINDQDDQARTLD